MILFYFEVVVWYKFPIIALLFSNELESPRIDTITGLIQFLENFFFKITRLKKIMIMSPSCL